MKPSDRYSLLMQQPEFVADEAQRASIALLDDLYERILAPFERRWWRRLVSSRDAWPREKGIYFWGGVGRGKTMIMDVFYQSLPAHVKSERIHFHGFMNRVHAELRNLKNRENPLQAVAAGFAGRARVLCLDEFVIIDIGDAMIITGLLEALFAQGVVLVTTSNAAPKDLYREGLQRARFLPAIELISRNCDIVNLDGEQDYRLRFLRQTDLYSVPHDESVETALRYHLEQQVAPLQETQAELVVNGRALACLYRAEDTVWFSFAQLCDTARSQNDYLELARFFSTLILTDIPRMESTDDDAARRFVLLIDVLYDHHVKLICSAAVTPERLYLGKRMAFEFERTASRLIEMQSPEYLASAHTQQ